MTLPACPWPLPGPGDTSAVLPEGGWWSFPALPARFVLSLTADEEK